MMFETIPFRTPATFFGMDTINGIGVEAKKLGAGKVLIVTGPAVQKAGILDKALSFLRKKQASCKNYLFAPGDLYLLMESVDEESLGGMPYTLLIKPGGKIIYRQLGMIDPSDLKKAIVEELGRYYK